MPWSDFTKVRRALYPDVIIKRLPSSTTMTFEKGGIHLTPYAIVEQLVLRGEAELV